MGQPSANRCRVTLVNWPHRVSDLFMALTSSKMLALGTPAPDFTLPDVVSGQTLTLSTFSAGKPLLVIFLCAHCPYVLHVSRELARLGRDYPSLAIVGISANDIVAYPADAPDKLKAAAHEWGLSFPICYDQTQEIARAYDAACTPDFYLFDQSHLLVYRGQLDDSRPGKGVPSGNDLRTAIDALLEGKPINTDQKPSAGCNIKWKSP